MDLLQSINISSSGMAAQSARLKMLSENIANADSVVTENGQPYRRKIMTFETVLDKQSGLQKVQIAKVTEDTKTPMKNVFEPSHPMADEKGFVSYPNVNTLVESLDMREASRMYEANMQAIESAKTMMARSMDLLR